MAYRKLLMLPALLIAGAVSGAAAQRPAGSLAGVWRLNPEKSQEMNPQAVGNYPGTWMGQRGTIGGAGRTGGIPSGGRQEPLPDPTVLLSLMRPILELRIQHTDSTIAIPVDECAKMSSNRSSQIRFVTSGFGIGWLCRIWGWTRTTSTSS